jgi:hypothetical protein
MNFYKLYNEVNLKDTIKEILLSGLNEQPIALKYVMVAKHIMDLYDYSYPSCWDDQFGCENSVRRELEKILAKELRGQPISQEQADQLSAVCKDYMEYVGQNLPEPDEENL